MIWLGRKLYYRLLVAPMVAFPICSCSFIGTERTYQTKARPSAYRGKQRTLEAKVWLRPSRDGLNFESGFQIGFNVEHIHWQVT